MKQLLNTRDQSLAENARLALDAEGIETLIESDTSATAHGSIVVSIVDDDTFDRAQAVLRDTSVTPPRSRIPTWLRWPIRLALLLILLNFLILMINEFSPSGP